MMKRSYFQDYTERNAKCHLKPFCDAIFDLHILPKNKKGIKVLDIGCAKGFMVKILRENGLEAYGVDVSEYAIGNAPSDINQYLFVANVESGMLPFNDGFFDFVVSMSTFEHLHSERMTFILREIQRILKPGGKIIINVPSPFNKKEAKKQEHITLLKRDWILLFERSGFNSDLRLSESFDMFRIKEVANLYVSSEKAFSFMGCNFILPKRIRGVATILMIFRRKLLAPNFSLVFCN